MKTLAASIYAIGAFLALIWATSVEYSPQAFLSFSQALELSLERGTLEGDGPAVEKLQSGLTSLRYIAAANWICSIFLFLWAFFTEHSSK